MNAPLAPPAIELVQAQGQVEAIAGPRWGGGRWGAPDPPGDRAQRLQATTVRQPDRIVVSLQSQGVLGLLIDADGCWTTDCRPRFQATATPGSAGRFTRKKVFSGVLFLVTGISESRKYHESRIRQYGGQVRILRPMMTAVRA
jgi:hypothetical protein